MKRCEPFIHHRGHTGHRGKRNQERWTTGHHGSQRKREPMGIG